MGWGAGGSCTPRPPIRPQTAQEKRVITVVFLGLLLDLLAFTLLLPLLPGLLESHGRAHDPLYGSWQRGVDWFAAAIRMPAEKRYNSVLFGVPLSSTHGGDLGLSGEAPGDAAVPGSHRGGLLAGLHPGPHAGCLPAHGDSTLAGPALRCLQPAVHFLFSARDPAPREAAAWQAPPVLPPPQAPSITPGFQAAADLLSPLALLRFSAVAQGQDPPAGDRLKSLRRLGLVYFLYLFLFSGLEYTLSFLAHQRFQFSSEAGALSQLQGPGAHRSPAPSLQQGKMFFFIGLTMAAVQGAYARRISPGGEIAAVKRAILLLVPAFLLIGWGLTLPVLGLGLLLYSFAAAVVVPCLSSVVANYGSPGQKGTIMGTLRSLGALARAVGPMVAASAYWLAGAQVCFTVCSSLFLLPFLLLWNLRPPAHALKAE
ncbi:major facilitator superfamily domain-containing protein 10 isoform X10 [Lutra lutra]|uniref:major facilitator superfamily domain-containing protein 10 isoform X10 n=1 Tax=Lutra lutra TaxID=9657 RepID=UPI001FD1AEE4|nr:major facilitator superfamily domain-containing protein 10 isoform X10 [Lutra lutra]